MNPLILIVDDDKKIANLIEFRLKKQGYATHCVFSGQEAAAAARELQPLLSLLDIRLPDKSGVDVLGDLQKESPQTRVIMISAHADVKLAVDCMKMGAYDFIEKPLAFPELDTKVRHVFDQYRLEEEVSLLKKELGEKYKLKSLIGKSAAMEKVYQGIDVAASSDVNVLIKGENGTGKELVARAIHFGGERKDLPFVAVNCAAIPENLLESELFGHEKGAFTGAVQRRIGKFEQAQDGTVFLDEVGELPPSLQVKLLRVLQEREIERVGGTQPIPIRGRFISATNKDLKKMIQEGKFREDLYFRLNVFPINVPPLRERKEDIPELLLYFIQKNRAGKTGPLKLANPVLRRLTEYAWPGNVREMENFVERLVLSRLDPAALSEEDVAALLDPVPFSVPSQESELVPAAHGWDKAKVLGEAEKSLLESALRETTGNISRASKLLNMSRDTFYRKMKQYAIARR